MRNLLLCAIFGLLMGCGNFTLDMPVWFEVDSRVPAELQTRRWATAAVTSLQGRVSPDAPQTIHIVWDGSNCGNATETSPHGPYGVCDTIGKTIHLCPYLGGLGATPVYDLARVELVVFHELGHAFGAGHVPCESGTVMVPHLECWQPTGLATDTLYGPADLEQICRSSSFGACSKVASRTYVDGPPAGEL